MDTAEDCFVLQILFAHCLRHIQRHDCDRMMPSLGSRSSWCPNTASRVLAGVSGRTAAKERQRGGCREAMLEIVRSRSGLGVSDLSDTRDGRVPYSIDPRSKGEASLAVDVPAFRPRITTSRCASHSASRSSGRCASNRSFHSAARTAGPTMAWGRSTAAVGRNSPRSMPRCKDGAGRSAQCSVARGARCVSRSPLAGPPSG